MASGIRLTASNLVRRYGVPGDLAGRIARLKSVKIDLAEEVARAAAQEGVGKLLGSARLRSAAALTTERLQSIRKSLRIEGPAEDLVVVPGRTWRTIAFAPGRLPEGAPPAIPVKAPSVPIRPEELEALFPADEVRRLKLAVLTSGNPSERISAIRRLALAPIPVSDKGSVLLSALSDEDPQVRVEVVKALVPLGLNPDVAREARHLVSGTEKQKTAAAGRVAELVAESGPGEASVLLALVAGTLKTELPAEARRLLIHSLAQAAPMLATDEAQLAGVVALLAEQLAERPAELARPVQRALAALAAKNTDGAVCALEAEVRRVSDRQARRLLLGAFSAIDVPPESRPPLAELMAEELLGAAEPETQCLGIANCLCRWGELAAEVLLRSVRKSVRQQKTFMVRVLDSIASGRGCSATTRRAVAEAFLAILRTESASVRSVILESEVFFDAALPPSLRSEIAGELIGHVHEFGGPRMIDVIEGAIAKIGPPAIAPLERAVVEGLRDRDRVSAARILGRIISRLPGRGKGSSRLAVETLMACVRQLDRGFPDRDVLAAAIGQMCTSKAMPPDTVRRVARGLRARVGREPYSFGLLDGLGRLAASPDVKLETRVEVADSLLRLLEVDLPEMQSRRYAGGEKTIFIAGAEAAAYTDMIPILLEGLRNVCVHAGSEALQERLVRVLIRKWREASSWRLIWGPANTLKLAEVLGEVAAAANCSRETRLEVVEALAGSDILPVLRVLGRLFVLDGSSAAMGEVAARAGERLLERMAARSGERIELDGSVLGTLAAVAARRNLGPADRADRIRSSAANVLFKALRNGVPEAKQALRKLADSPAVGRKLREEIQNRLAES